MRRRAMQQPSGAIQLYYPNAQGDCPVVNDKPESVRRVLEAEL